MTNEFPEPPDTARFTPTFDDAFAAYRLRYRLSRWRAVGGALFIAVFIALLNYIADAPNKALLVAIPLSIAFYALLIYLIRRFAFPRWVRKVYRQQAGLKRETTFAWDDAGLHWRTENGSGLTPWGDYTGRRENEEILLLFHSDALFQFVPRRILTEPQHARLAGLAATVPHKR